MAHANQAADLNKKNHNPFTILKTISLALLIGLFIRIFLFQPFHIPSRSMEPGLVKGDYVIASKYAYGFGRHSLNPLTLNWQGRLFNKHPKRGDIIVFKPKNEKTFYIKRLIGLPGDRIQIRNGELFINDLKQNHKVIDDGVPKSTGVVGIRILQESLKDSSKVYKISDALSGSKVDNTPIYTVPLAHYFFLGDNRDYSFDSRYSQREGGIGMVSSFDLVGRAEFILLSTKSGFNIFNPMTWNRVRGERMLKGL